ncbi:cilium assembly protein DZIP1-like isoform X2 [Gordionus sp. m RMFG-2023]|uniref:cilium assembly protein DZIP1-like isoform X2 n=1 Tax=Gordionus sp. m RMFG-2023 TaxID=3053472 RepID=UPI0031FBCE97
MREQTCKIPNLKDEIIGEQYFFKPRKIKIDWKKIASIDFDTFSPDKDFDKVQQNIFNITYCDIENEFGTTNLNVNFIKLFKISQYTIEYLLFTQDRLLKKINLIHERFEELYKNALYQKKTLISTKDRLFNARREIKKQQQIIKSYKEIFVLCGINKKDINGLIHQCPYCTKAFVSDDFLTSHLERRHFNRHSSKILPKEIKKDKHDFGIDESEDDNIKLLKNKDNLNSNPSISPQDKSMTSLKDIRVSEENTLNAINQLCQLQEVKYLKEMKYFKDNLNLQMKYVADNVIDLVQDKLTTKSFIPNENYQGSLTTTFNPNKSPKNNKSILSTQFSKRHSLKSNKSLKDLNIQNIGDIKDRENTAKMIKIASKDMDINNEIQLDALKPDVIFRGDKKESITNANNIVAKEKFNNLDAQLTQLESSYNEKLLQQQREWEKRMDRLEEIYRKKLNDGTPKHTQEDSSAKKVGRQSSYSSETSSDDLSNTRFLSNSKSNRTSSIITSTPKSLPAKTITTPKHHHKNDENSKDVEMVKFDKTIVKDPNWLINPLLRYLNPSHRNYAYRLSYQGPSLVQEYMERVRPKIMKSVANQMKHYGIDEAYPKFMDIKSRITKMLEHPSSSHQPGMKLKHSPKVIQSSTTSSDDEYSTYTASSYSASSGDNKSIKSQNVPSRIDDTRKVVKFQDSIAEPIRNKLQPRDAIVKDDNLPLDLKTFLNDESTPVKTKKGGDKLNRDNSASDTNSLSTKTSFSSSSSSSLSIVTTGPPKHANTNLGEAEKKNIEKETKTSSQSSLSERVDEVRDVKGGFNKTNHHKDHIPAKDSSKPSLGTDRGREELAVNEKMTPPKQIPFTFSPPKQSVASGDTEESDTSSSILNPVPSNFYKAKEFPRNLSISPIKT